MKSKYLTPDVNKVVELNDRKAVHLYFNCK